MTYSSMFQVLQKRATTNASKRRQRAKLGETDQAAYKMHRCKLKEIRKKKKDARYQSAMQQDVTAILRDLTLVTASLTKFKNRYGHKNTLLIQKRFLIIREESMEAKHPW